MAKPMTKAEIDAFIGDEKDGDAIEKYNIENFGSVGPTTGLGGRRRRRRSRKKRRKSRKKRRKSRKSKKRKSRRRRRR